MKVGGVYSHLNGREYLLVHLEKLWREVLEVISEVDAESCRTKVSKEQRMVGRVLYSPDDLNASFKQGFEQRGWRQRRNTFWVTDDEKLLRRIYSLSSSEQKTAIEAEGRRAIMSYNQTDFVKDRVAVEIQFGKYSFVAHDLFVKHLSFYVSDIIDVGIEVVPMKVMEKQMSSGVAYFERDLMNVARQGRGVPAVPLILIGVEP